MGRAEMIQQAIDYIEAHLDEELELEQIARSAAMSVPNMYRMFYAMTGHPVKEYIRKRRLSEAANLLRLTELSVIDIGFRCGFDTYQTFAKTFKRTVGITPGLYRKAEFIYSFERIKLHEQVYCLEEKEVSERFADVSVIRAAPMKGIAYLHKAREEKGIEQSALARFRAMLAESGMDSSSMRLYGWNVDLEEGVLQHGYRMLAVSDCELPVLAKGQQELELYETPGGLYAVTRTGADSPSAINAAWNRLLAEWLPRSTFELGGHGLMEEFQQYGSQIARMKLYLPLMRRQEQETIAVEERKPHRVAAFRARGEDSAEQADRAAAEWIEGNGLVGSGLAMFMSCSYGVMPGPDYHYDIFIELPEQCRTSKEESTQIALLDGGLYASLRTKAYGSMSGVLERMYRWLANSDTYELDESRSWYARYIVQKLAEGEDIGHERAVEAECCVPVVGRNECV